MARKHSIKKKTETNYNTKTGNFSVTETEEHLIIDDTPHDFLPDDDSDDEEDLMFLSKTKKYLAIDDELGLDDEPALIVRIDDDKF